MYVIEINTKLPYVQDENPMIFKAGKTYDAAYKLLKKLVVFISSEYTDFRITTNELKQELGCSSWTHYAELPSYDTQAEDNPTYISEPCVVKRNYFQLDGTIRSEIVFLIKIVKLQEDEEMTLSSMFSKPVITKYYNKKGR